MSKIKQWCIVDDIVFTGGSLISMAEQCMKLGAKKVYACGNSWSTYTRCSKKIENSPIKNYLLRILLNINLKNSVVK